MAGGTPNPQPHRTLGLAESVGAQRALRHELDAAFTPALPVQCNIEALSLLVSDDAGMWTLRERFPLGSYAIGRSTISRSSEKDACRSFGSCATVVTMSSSAAVAVRSSLNPACTVSGPPTTSPN